MRILFPLIVTALTSGVALAECNTLENTFMTCTFNRGKKQVSVCLNNTDASYAFGKVGHTPDLELSTPLRDLDFVPWPGVSTPFESVIFSNKGVQYSITAGQTYVYPEDENEDTQTRPWGDIEVIENGQIIATLICDENSTIYNWDSKISDAKRALGQCWDFDVRQWITCN